MKRLNVYISRSSDSIICAYLIIYIYINSVSSRVCSSSSSRRNYRMFTILPSSLSYSSSKIGYTFPIPSISPTKCVIIIIISRSITTSIYHTIGYYCRSGKWEHITISPLKISSTISFSHCISGIIYLCSSEIFICNCYPSYSIRTHRYKSGR